MSLNSFDTLDTLKVSEELFHFNNLTRLHNKYPEIQKLLNSNKPASKELAVLLLNHPAVLELVDQPEFREAALSAFRETVMPPNRSSTNP